mgnify:CR=1 FL=1
MKGKNLLFVEREIMYKLSVLTGIAWVVNAKYILAIFEIIPVKYLSYRAVSNSIWNKCISWWKATNVAQCYE